MPKLSIITINYNNLEGLKRTVESVVNQTWQQFEYIVIDGGAPTTVSYISNASPVPADKNEIAMCTAMAGEMLGMKLIYMDAGSGAKRPITESMIKAVADHIEAPLIIGGGILQPEKAYLNCKAGADVIVVGNAIEKDASLIKEMAAAIHSVPVKA